MHTEYIDHSLEEIVTKSENVVRGYEPLDLVFL